MLKVATFGFAVATIAVIYLLFVGSVAYSFADFDCDGTYWQCHRGAAQELALYAGVPLLGWVVYGWLLIRAWKRR